MIMKHNVYCINENCLDDIETIDAILFSSTYMYKVQLCSFLGCLAACRHIKSVLIVVPATILSSWLSHLKIWAPGLRRILIHKSHDSSHVISKSLLNDLNRWLQTCRQECWYEAIDEQDLKQEHDNNHHHNNNNHHKDQDKWNKFCGTGYAVVTTYENLRRNADVYISNRWSYVVLDGTYIHTIYISWIIAN